MSENFNSTINRNLIRGDRLRKELDRQDRESNGVCALTRALMKVPINRNPNKGPLLLEEQKHFSSNSNRNALVVLRPNSQNQHQSFQADYSDKALAIIDKAKINAHVEQDKLERILIAQERRSNAASLRMQKKVLLDSIQSQQPMIELAAQQARRMKVDGDPAREVEAMRIAEREEARRTRRLLLKQEEEEY